MTVSDSVKDLLLLYLSLLVASIDFNVADAVSLFQNFHCSESNIHLTLSLSECELTDKCTSPCNSTAIISCYGKTCISLK